MNNDSEDPIRDEFLPEENVNDLGPSEEGGGDFQLAKSPKAEEEKDAKRKNSSFFNDFLQQFEQEANTEAKIRLSMDFMRAALTHTGTPRFKDFWEGRRMCLPLFKENISSKARSQLWSAYIELSTEAKKLKEILDEQSAFAIEQIELAIQALERDLENYDLILSQSPPVNIDLDGFSLEIKKEFYLQIQRELQFLNTLAARVNALRKEVVKTEMRIRIKNKLLERLSLCGDHVFPKRKELIKKVSQEFTDDVDKFIATHFQDEAFKDVPLYALREEIKLLQSTAKILTLNTHAFTQTRLKLSNCWDKIKSCEKDRKKETQAKRQAFKQNFDIVMEKIKPFAEACLAGTSVEECNRQATEILDFMRTVELGRDEVRILKEEVYKAKRGPLERAREREAERLQKEREAEAQKRDKINALKEELNVLLAQAASLEIDLLVSKREDLQRRFEEVAFAKAEEHVVDRLFKQLKDSIDDKREKALLSLSDDDLKVLEQLKAVLQERKQRRQEVKGQLEHYRKLLGGSGFDFEKAMLYREQIESEKASLEKINSSIDEIEEKISEIEG